MNTITNHADRHQDLFQGNRKSNYEFCAVDNKIQSDLYSFDNRYNNSNIYRKFMIESQESAIDSKNESNFERSRFLRIKKEAIIKNNKKCLKNNRIKSDDKYLKNGYIFKKLIKSIKEGTSSIQIAENIPKVKFVIPIVKLGKTINSTNKELENSVENNELPQSNEEKLSTKLQESQIEQRIKKNKTSHPDKKIILRRNSDSLKIQKSFYHLNPSKSNDYYMNHKLNTQEANEDDLSKKQPTSLYSSNVSIPYGNNFKNLI